MIETPQIIWQITHVPNPIKQISHGPITNKKIVDQDSSDCLGYDCHVNSYFEIREFGSDMIHRYNTKVPKNGISIDWFQRLVDLSKDVGSGEWEAKAIFYKLLGAFFFRHILIYFDAYLFKKHKKMPNKL